MKNKISTIFVIVMLLLINIIGITVLSVEEGEGTSKKLNGIMVENKENIELLGLKNNKIADLGSAIIVGDGTKDGSYVDAEAQNELYLVTPSETSYVDFYISYSMICDGATDSGLIILTIQINGATIGSNQVATIDYDEGKLKVLNVQVSWKDVFSYEISVIYSNIVPLFSVSILIPGGGVIGPNSKDEDKCKSFIFSDNQQIHLRQSLENNNIGTNNPPVANFSWSPDIPIPGERVRFDASESYDPDGGSISGYYWDFNDSNFATGKIVNHTFIVPGHYDVKLYIQDDEEDTGYCNKMVYVGYLPVAEFTFSPKYPELGENVLFDGSPSYDKDGGDIILYKWDFDDDGHYETSGKKIGKVYPHRGMYAVGLCVVDDEGQMNTTEKIISVGKPPIPEFTWSPMDPEPGQIVTFNASESYDPETDIRWYEWDWNDDGFFDEKNYYEPISTFSFQNKGQYSVTLRVTNIWSVYNMTKKIVNVGIDEEPPTIPDINGETNGKNGNEYEYSFLSIDANGYDIYYHVDWGDGSEEEVIGPTFSGVAAAAKHTWAEPGIYLIRAKAKNTIDLESDWGTLEISMPKNKPIIIPFLNYLENHPNMFPLLKQILGRYW